MKRIIRSLYVHTTCAVAAMLPGIMTIATETSTDTRISAGIGRLPAGDDSDRKVVVLFTRDELCVIRPGDLVTPAASSSSQPWAVDGQKAMNGVIRIHDPPADESHRLLECWTFAPRTSAPEHLPLPSV